VNFEDTLSRSVVSIIRYEGVADTQLIMTRQNFSYWSITKISASILKMCESTGCMIKFGIYG